MSFELICAMSGVTLVSAVVGGLNARTRWAARRQQQEAAQRARQEAARLLSPELQGVPLPAVDDRRWRRCPHFKNNRCLDLGPHHKGASFSLSMKDWHVRQTVNNTVTHDLGFWGQYVAAVHQALCEREALEAIEGVVDTPPEAPELDLL